MPSKYQSSFHEQLSYLASVEEERANERSRSLAWQNKQKSLVMTRNKAIADSIGGSITHVEQVNPNLFSKKREEVRSRLFTVGGEDYAANQLEELGDPFAELPDVTGQSVHLFPFIQWPLLNENYEYNLFKQILQLAAEQIHPIRLSSGYFNIDQQLFSEIVSANKENSPIQFLCSAPEAYSFFRGEALKSLIPSMYRCYQYELIRALGQKAVIKQFSNRGWSFHAKGLWLEQSQNSYITVVGSSNFNARSRSRDTQLQLYIYSTCKGLNTRLNNEWQQIQKECKPIKMSNIVEDKQTRVSWPY